MESMEYVVKISADASDAINKINQVGDRLESLDKPNLGSALAEQASKMSGTIAPAFDLMQSMEKAISSAQTITQPLGANLAAEFTPVMEGFQSFASYVSDVEQHLVSSRASLESYAEAAKSMLTSLGSDAPRRQVSELMSLTKQVDKLSASYGNQEDKIIDIRMAMNEASSQLQGLEQAQNTIVSNATKELAIAMSRLEEYQQKANEIASDGFNVPKGIQNIIDGMQRRIESLTEGVSGNHMELPGYAEYSQQYQALKQYVAELSAQLRGEEQTLASLDSQAGLYSARISGLVSEQEKASASVGGSIPRFAQLGMVLADLARQAGLMAISFGKFARGAIQNGLSNIRGLAGGIADRIKEWSKGTSSASDAVRSLYKRFTGFFRMMSTRLKRMAISTIFKDMAESSRILAGMSQPYNQAISGMVASSKQLGAQLLAMAEPIISVLGPAIQTLIDLLNTGADRLSQFTARLAGRDTYFRASKGIYDYATAQQEAESATNKATKANNQFRASILSFDELHTLNGADYNETTDDASALTGITDKQLDQATIQANAFSELAEKLRNAWQARDFRGFGAAIAEAVGDAFTWLKNAVGWTANAARFTDAIEGIADTINGFAEKLDGISIGTALADIGNTVIEGFNSLVTRVSGSEIGVRLGEIISSFAQNLDWHTAGQNLIAGFQLAIDALNGFLSTTALSDLGTGVANFFSGIVSEFDAAKWGNVLAGIINGLANFFANAFDPETFAQMGTNIADALNIAFGQLEPDTLANGINNFVSSITALINNLISNLDLTQVGQTLSQVGAQLDWSSIFELIGIAAAPFLLSSGTKLLGSALTGIFSSAIGGIPLLVGGLITAITAAVALNWDKIVAFGTKITDFFGGIFTSIGEGFGEIIDNIGGFFGGLFDAVSGGFKGIISSVSGIGDFANNLFGGIGNGVKGIFGGIGEGLSNGLSGIGGWFGDRIEDLRSIGANSAEQDIQQNVIQNSALATPVGMDINGATNNITAGFNTAIQQATSMILNALNSSGDINLYVDSERLARATVRGLNLADVRQNSTGQIAFV